MDESTKKVFSDAVSDLERKDYVAGLQKLKDILAKEPVTPPPVVMPSTSSSEYDDGSRDEEYSGDESRDEGYSEDESSYG